VHHRAEALSRNRCWTRSSSRRPSQTPASRLALSTSSRAAGRSAPTWSSSATWTRSPSPARPPRAGASPETCGRLLRPVTLELGGKSAAIVLDDADLDLARIGNDLFAATLLNNGQTCYLGTRVLAPRSRYDEVVDTLAAFASSLAVGGPLDPATQIGPMASLTHRDRVEGYIAKGSCDGARPVAGGGRPQQLDRGWFVEPTVFAGVDNASTIAQEEIFGPVLSVISYSDVDDAVRIANDSDYGLGGSVWTTDPERGKDVARRVRTGTIGINRYLPDPGAPFGGVKASGIGRELGPDAINAYQQFKSIYA
jgi:acyl-CoA reductase-like NAD-dependent aldehyde dehydrogenase